MSKLKQSASDKGQYSAYSNGRHTKNTLAKLERTVKQQPNNLQAQAALTKALKDGVTYMRSRKSFGHTCKGMNKSLGFDKNQPNEYMKKTKLDLHWYRGCSVVHNHTVPNHGKSMCDQFIDLGYEKPKHVRKYKKTTR